MSQESRLCNVRLITSRGDVVSVVKNTIGFRDNFSVYEDLSIIGDGSTIINILDVALLENCAPIVLMNLRNRKIPILFLETSDNSERIKKIIEEKFRFVVPFPLEASVLRKYLEIIESEIKNKTPINILSKSLELTNTESFFGCIVGTSKIIKMVRTQIEKVAENDSPVLLIGETGTGKTTTAEIIHKLSKRRNKEMVKLSMSAIVESLAGSTFFGTDTGAFTDAKAKKGFFKKADKSTLFLDEIGLATPIVQAMLLNVLNSWEIQKVGSDIIEKVDIRLITATNENLSQLVEDGTFRLDLYHRINDNIIEMPSLRNRKEDLPEIVKKHLIDKQRIISDSAMNKIIQYDWPGNIRQLHKCLDRAVEFYDKEIITAENLDFNV